ncbi:MAG: FKBP-type peptidyl-prolyl cis-trans isomerase [Clostridia bacterium]|nr:FKBP-type peptidyl-prolyl cis-trans isomerase [Clostridia bacterium]
MKKIIAVLLCFVMVAALAACGGDDSQARYDYDLSEYITVGDYKNLDVTIYTKTRDQEKQEVIDYYTSYYATPDKTATAADGDTVYISYTCTVDGAKVDKESATNTYVVLGSETLLPEVEAAIVGLLSGKTVTVEATFPADYESEAEVAGKTATFEVTLTHVMIDAEYNDAFVAAYFAGYGVSTMAEFDEYMNRNFLLNAVLDAIQGNPTYKVIAYPERELNEAVDEQFTYEDSAYKNNYGFGLADILEASGKTVDEYKAELKKDETILATVETEMLYYHIIRSENFAASDEEASELRSQLISEGVEYYRQLYVKNGITGSTLDSYLVNVLAALQETYTVEGCKQNILYDLVEELIVNGQNVSYVDEFAPEADTEEKTETN